MPHVTWAAWCRAELATSCLISMLLLFLGLRPAAAGAADRSWPGGFMAMFGAVVIASRILFAAYTLRVSEVGGGNGAERRPPPGIQAQRPSPSHRTHRTHDTTDQWRDRFRWLGRTEALFVTRRVLHEIPSRASGELL